MNMRSLTFDDTNFALASNNNNNNKTSSVCSGTSSFSSEGSPPHRFHISIEHVDDDESNLSGDVKLSSNHKPNDSESVCFECQHCNNDNNLNLSRISGLELKQDGFVFCFLLKYAFLIFNLLYRMSATMATSTNSSLNESQIDNSELNSIGNGHVCKHGNNSKAVPFGSMENLGARLSGFNNRYRTTSFGSYRSSSVNSHHSLHTRESANTMTALQTRCNRSYHDNTCCLTKNKDIIKDERIVFVTGKSRGPIGIFSALSSNHSKRNQRDHHSYHHHSSRFVLFCFI